MYKDLENSLMSTQQYSFGKLFLTCVCACADVLCKEEKEEKVSNEYDELIKDIKDFKALANKKGNTYVDNFFRDDYEGSKEYTLFIKLVPRYGCPTYKNREIQMNISGPTKAVAYLRFYYIISTVEHYLTERERLSWFDFKPAFITPNIEKWKLILIYREGMPDKPEDDIEIRNRILEWFDCCFDNNIMLDQDRLVYNFSKIPYTWVLVRRIKNVSPIYSGRMKAIKETVF